MNVLKLSEHIYAASFSKLHTSYFDGFPQREKQLLCAMDGLNVHWFKHPPLVATTVVSQLQAEMMRYVERNDIDCILFDNPVSSLLFRDEDWDIAVFDCCDWYLDYYLCEFGRDSDYCRLESAMNIVLSKCRSTIFQSTTIETWFRARAHPGVIRSIVLPNGYNPAFFYPGEATFRFDQPTALFAGKLGRWYSGLKTIVRGLPEGWQLVLVGDGPCRDEFSELVNVRCTGCLQLREVGDYMRAADVCVFPVDDCSPIATSEYLACGKPVVHRGDKITWMIQDGVNGYIASDDPINWQEKILEAAQSSSALRQQARLTPRTWGALRGDLRAWLEELYR